MALLGGASASARALIQTRRRHAFQDSSHYYAANSKRATLKGRVAHVDDKIRPVCATPKPMYVTTSATIAYSRVVPSLTPRDERYGCLDTCVGKVNDGVCDDGGDNAQYTSCPLGTDCTDCGPIRSPIDGCNEDCPTAKDGVCDDGGPGSEFARCVFGSDCRDCGARDLHPTRTIECTRTYSTNVLNEKNEYELEVSVPSDLPSVSATISWSGSTRDANNPPGQYQAFAGNSCGAGFERITDYDECKAALEGMGVSAPSISRSELNPSGCLYLSFEACLRTRHR